MPAEPFPLIQARGDHRRVGRQIGEALRPQIQRRMAMLPDSLPAGVTWEELLDHSWLYEAPTRVAYPHYIAELEGIAEGAGVAFERVFLSHCEELWESAAWPRGCTDLVARGCATADGSTLVAHTNDLSPRVENDLVILQVQAGDDPEFLGVSVAGLGYSAGFNAAGISMTGNELANNDIRPGVPRLLVVRSILAARRLGEALDACLLPQRASSYNNVVADAHGEVYSMEGSATDCEPIYIEDDLLAHANHYVSPAMRRFEADRNDIGSSVYRHNRARRLLQENRGRLSPELFQALLADHAGYPASICKHGLESVTVFSLIVNLNERRAWIGRGRPCRTTYHEYRLDPWALPEDWTG
jgi:isopenicillin-N N-acyltransferase-like protein